MSYKISEKTLKFCNSIVNKKEFYALNLVDIDKRVVSDKFKHNEKGLKYFIGYTDDNIIRTLCVILPQISKYIKYFNVEGKISLLKLKMITYF